MRILINLIILVLGIGLSWLLYQSINEPIEFEDELYKRERTTIIQMEKIRDAQQAYREITGEYAATYDTLKQVLMNDSFKIVQIFDDPDAENEDKIRFETYYVNAKDSLSSKWNTNSIPDYIDGISKVPFGENNEIFEMASTIIEYQNTNVPVVEVKTRYSSFMGEKYSNPRFKRYNPNYEPSNLLKFGDMSRPTVAGNWKKK